MATCPNFQILQLLESSLDRQEEAAWCIRQMEQNYHEADKFRWSLNSFLRALQEVLQLVSMEIQSKPDIVRWFREHRAALDSDPLIALFFKRRNMVVHKSMLKPSSKGSVGYTRGRGLKIGLSMPIDPMVDSQVAILRYIGHVAKTDFDFLGILYTKDDGGGEYTCVQREWRLKDFPDQEVTQLCAQAWERVAGLTLATAQKMGANVIIRKFELGNPHSVQFEIYRPEWVNEQLSIAKVRHAESARSESA